MDYAHTKLFILDAIKEFDNFLPFKIMGSIILSVYAVAFGDTKHDIVLAIILLVTIDLITGLLASYIMGLKISSLRFFRTPLKVCVFYLMLTSAHQVGVIIPDIESFLVGSMAGFLAVNEFISIIENVGNMGFQTPQKLLNKLKKIQDNE